MTLGTIDYVNIKYEAFCHVDRSVLMDISSRSFHQFGYSGCECSHPS